MPGTRSHESPPSWLLNKDAGSTPHHRSFLPLPASSPQMLASARPSSLGNAGADFVSVNLFPISVERNTFMPKNGLQLEAYRRGLRREIRSDAGVRVRREQSYPPNFAASKRRRLEASRTRQAQIQCGPLLDRCQIMGLSCARDGAMRSGASDNDTQGCRNRAVPRRPFRDYEIFNPAEHSPAFDSAILRRWK
jgi:hypothetical protein